MPTLVVPHKVNGTHVIVYNKYIKGAFVKARKQTTMEQFKVSKTEPIFVMVRDQENKIRIAMGRYVISQKKFDNYKQAEQYIASKPYEIMLNATMVVAKLTKNGELNNETQETKLEENKEDANK